MPTHRALGERRSGAEDSANPEPAMTFTEDPDFKPTIKCDIDATGKIVPRVGEYFRAPDMRGSRCEALYVIEAVEEYPSVRISPCGVVSTHCLTGKAVL